MCILPCTQSRCHTLWPVSVVQMPAQVDSGKVLVVLVQLSSTRANTARILCTVTQAVPVVINAWDTTGASGTGVPRTLTTGSALASPKAWCSSHTWPGNGT
jgi:hypothetical protein